MRARVWVVAFVAACGEAQSSGPVGSQNSAQDPGDASAGNETSTAAPLEQPTPVLEHHGSPSRAGAYVVPGLTRARALALRLDTEFEATYPGVLDGEGNVNAQPLYVPSGPGNEGAIYVVTETSDVYALGEADGHTIWHVNLGPPATEETAACKGGLDPNGITSTPVIDLPSRTLYVDAVQSEAASDAGTVRNVTTHLVHALSIDDGTERAGWPFDPRGLSSNGHDFDAPVEHQRGALALVNGTLYVPHGSLADCGDYHGWIVAVPTADPSKASGWAVPGPRGGIWAPNGVASDGTSLFFATGNGGGDDAGAWAGGEGVFRFVAASPIGTSPDDSFHAPDWQALDQLDMDLGGSGAVPFSIQGASPSNLVVALGKDGNLYLLDAANMATPVAVTQVATKNIVGAPAVLANEAGALVVFDALAAGLGTNCPEGQAGDLVAVQISRGSPPTMSTVWCAQNGYGSPIVTTTDGTSDPIVWVTSMAYGVLHAYDATTGEQLFEGPEDESLDGAYRFDTIIPTAHHLVIAANTQVYAFSL